MGLELRNARAVYSVSAIAWKSGAGKVCPGFVRALSGLSGEAGEREENVPQGCRGLIQ